jgi:hypothetical protein
LDAHAPLPITGAHGWLRGYLANTRDASERNYVRADYRQSRLTGDSYADRLKISDGTESRLSEERDVAIATLSTPG